ncbi:trypsin-like peptidase domain-containing protein [Limobrevibacterium gyesilva]|uniref:Probable periplasmic serine endoprotease DegP-like n=1 Tax=Limobrevibacterium gyesilva TaxID=2991712 RepID=A0AA41YIJ8_9PROT|nr:trypsin-like peptidase domain-containing protein [Limobrevibacterium gyesilva]MCW3474216.1 trypsin-like peptidase domain-containing protein [Limobrevibacterium gyesilva]
MRCLTLRALVCAAALALSAPLAPWPATAAEPVSGLAELIPGLLPAVVNISTIKVVQAPPTPGKPGAAAAASRRKSLGSGFVIEPSGIIMTARHVIDTAVEITVTLFDGNQYRAQVLYKAPIDLALLKIDAGHPLPTIKWGDSESVRVGDLVIAIGNPLGLGSTVTSGIVSALDRDIQETPFDAFLQTDAATNPGNSGGPLFNVDGEVIGVSNSIFTPSSSSSDSGSIGLAFALPGNDAQFVLNHFKQYGRVRAGYLGAHVQPVTPAIADALGLQAATGVLVTAVDDASPAAQAQLRDGDVILKIGERPIPNVRHYNRAVGGTPFDEVAALVYWRDGQEVTIQVPWAENPRATSTAEVIMPPPLPRQERSDLGLTLAPITDAIRAKYKIPPRQKGVVVTRVAPNSIAADMGITAGDVVVKASLKPIGTPADLEAAVHAARAEGRRHLLVMFSDESGPRWVAVPLKPAA